MADAYTPLYYQHGGVSHEAPDEDESPTKRALVGQTMNAQGYLRTMHVFGLRAAPDLAVPLTGCTERVVDRSFHFFRNACAWAEEEDANLAYFNDQEVEADSASWNAIRTDPKATTHRGRVLVIKHRKTGQSAFTQLPNTKVQKGAPSPPETYDEVRGPMVATIGPKSFLGVDGAKTWPKVAKLDLGGIPVGPANHGAKIFVKPAQVKLPKSFPVAALAQRPKAPRGFVRFQGGDNRAEAAFTGVKGVGRKRNALKATKHSGGEFLCAAYLLKHPGLHGVASAVRRWLQAHVDKVRPDEAWTRGRQRSKDAAPPRLARKRPAGRT